MFPRATRPTDLTWLQWIRPAIWQSAASFPRHRRVRARSTPLRTPQPWPPRSVRPPLPLESPHRCTSHLPESSGKRERRIRMPYSARQYIGTCMLRRRLTRPRPKAAVCAKRQSFAPATRNCLPTADAVQYRLVVDTLCPLHNSYSGRAQHPWCSSARRSCPPILSLLVCETLGRGCNWLIMY